jgi:hypothetical protein
MPAAETLLALHQWRSIYKARMYLTVNTTTTVANTGIQVPFDTISYDPNGNLTLGATANYTVPVAGYYSVNGRAALSNSSHRTFPFIVVNGSDTHRGQDEVGVGGICNGVVKVNASDVISFGMWCDTSGLGFDQAGGLQAVINFMCVHLLAPL